MSYTVLVVLARWGWVRSLISRRSFLLLSKVLDEAAIMSLGALFIILRRERIGPRRFLRQGFWLVEKRYFYLWVYFYISTGWMRGIYLRSDVFYSFCNKLPFSQHPVNVVFLFLPKCLLDFLPECFYLSIYLFVLFVYGYIQFWTWQIDWQK